MKYLKLFEELSITEEYFPSYGYKLNSKEKKILVGLVGKYLDSFTIRKEDGYYYTSYLYDYNQFDGFNDLKDYILFHYYMSNDGLNPNKLLKLLKSSTLDPSFDNNRLLRWASLNGHTKILKLLLQDPRIDPSYDDSLVIRNASASGHKEIVELLLKDPRVDPSDRNNLAIAWATSNGQKEIVELLLKDPRVDPSDRNNLSIAWASQYGHIEIVKLLLKDSRVDPSDDDNLAINLAVEFNHTEIVKLLLQDPRVRKKLTEEEIERYEAS